jgi:L-amino acid N-acyltransferase YncA
MNELSIRTVRPHDIPAITRIYADAVEHGTATFEITAPDETEMARRQQALLTGKFPYLVAESAGAVVGYAYAGPYRDRRAYDWCVEDSIYIARQFHRRRIGSTLLAALIEAAEQRGFRQMIAVIGDSANTASVAVHAAVGFRLVGSFAAIGFKHGRWLDTVLMQRPLGNGDSTPPATP